MAEQKELTIRRGETYTQVLRWETEPVISKPITAISFALGSPRLTVVGHGVPDGWRIAATRVKGPKQINAENSPPSDNDYHPATVIDANTIELNGVVPADDNGNEWPAYLSGGFIQYNTPVNLTGYTARNAFKAKAGTARLMRCSVAGTSGETIPTGPGTDGTATWESVEAGSPANVWAANTVYAEDAIIDLDDLLRLTTENGGLTIDAAAYTITREISAAQSAAAKWKRAEQELDMVSSTGRVTTISRNAFILDKEVTK